MVMTMMLKMMLLLLVCELIAGISIKKFLKQQANGRITLIG